MGHTVDFVTLMGRTHKQISAERKERLKPVLKGDIRTLSNSETSHSKYLFGGNLLESIKEAKESFRISNSLVNNSTTKFQKVSYQSGSKRSFDTQIVVLVPGFLLPILSTSRAAKGTTSIEGSHPAAPNMSPARNHTSIEEMCI